MFKNSCLSELFIFYFYAFTRGDFLMEFVGEILNHREYRSRVKQYAKEKNVHSYFMALKPDEILDATYKGNHSRFINHSCNPNCETQKVSHANFVLPIIPSFACLFLIIILIYLWRGY